MGTRDRRAINGVRRASAPSGEPPGCFVVLEGIDGAGTTTQSARLAGALRERGRDVVETREPTNGPWGQRYRRWARGDLQATPGEVLGFFLEDRREHVAGIVEPALGRGAIVVCDRYVPSTIAYQTAAGVPREVVMAALDAQEFPEPDLTLWLRVPVERALARKGSAVREKFEEVDFLRRVESEYARLGMVEIDASQSLEQVAEIVLEHVLEIVEHEEEDDDE
jgi:dTMP kinase